MWDVLPCKTGRWCSPNDYLIRRSRSTENWVKHETPIWHVTLVAISGTTILVSYFKSSHCNSFETLSVLIGISLTKRQIVLLSYNMKSNQGWLWYLHSFAAKLSYCFGLMVSAIWDIITWHWTIRSGILHKKYFKLYFPVTSDDISDIFGKIRDDYKVRIWLSFKIWWILSIGFP